MRFLLGFASGVAAAWAALAIWQRVPPLGPVDATDEDVWEPRRGDCRPGFDDSVALHSGGSYSESAHVPVGMHDPYCRWPMRPCVCTVMHPVTGGIGAP